MDFYQIQVREAKGRPEVYPNFIVANSKDLMVRGHSFYALWDEEKQLWSTDEYLVPEVIDKDLKKWATDKYGDDVESVNIRYIRSFDSNSWLQFRKFVQNLSDSGHQLDECLTFANEVVRKEHYVSRKLPYSLQAGDYSAWDELIGTLYSPTEREKLEWAIGSIISGDSTSIQKFLVLYGSAGTGKSTVLNIIQKLFEGYYVIFEAKALTSSNNAFAAEMFRSNPLVAIQHDGDLSHIEDNTKLNSIISHEEVMINEKYKPGYPMRINAFLFMGTNKPVRITDAKSGIIRRLIDVKPSGVTVSPRKYQALTSQIDFELGAIAQHCLEVYRYLGKDYYSGYRPVEMMLETDIFFNYIEAYYDVFKERDGITLNEAYEMYKRFCEESLVERKMAKYRFREELRNYFLGFDDRADVGGTRVRSWYSGFKGGDHFKERDDEEKTFSLVMDETHSLLDEILADYPAQYATVAETPSTKWERVTRHLSDLDTTRLHFVKLPENHIVIDFDLKDADGRKSLERNLEAASGWPPTYAEFSKSGSGIHLHYIYEGDVNELLPVYEEGIEVKVFTGNSSLRRRLTKCNSIPIASLNGGLPLKEKKLIEFDQIKSERALRELIERNLRKDIHPGTKPSIDFIHKILEDVYSQGLVYDVSDMRQKILAFANKSTNHALYCIKQVQDMKFASEVINDDPNVIEHDPESRKIAFFDCEVFPNLFVVCWKYEGAPDDEIVSLINPDAETIEKLLTLKLVGFNNRRYDNHILYARFMGYDNLQLFYLSQKIVAGNISAMFREAYNVSYTDIYDFSSLKQSLKKFEIDLGIHHMENEFPWDQPVAEEYWPKVVSYCENDVIATEAVFHARKQDFVARQLLSALSGLSVNATTQQHASKIIFGDVSHPQQDFVYTDLSKDFPGYHYEFGKSTYRGEETGEGGYVYAEPGIYGHVALLDIASMHPTSIEQLDLFGDYTKKFSELKNARIAIKRKDHELLEYLLDGKLKPYLGTDEDLEALSYAMKIVINIVYGLTAARFDNAFRDPRNVDNIVAKRGALFMIDLKHFVQEQGFTVIHIKTDSIKIANATNEIIDAVMEFGQNYGYEFEHEDTYDKICLVNDAVYIAKTEPGRKPVHWVAVGAQFQHPYVFKRLFSHEPLEFSDYCETRSVTTSLYLERDGEHRFVGRTGLFVPVIEGIGGGQLMREKDGKFYSVSGTKGYLWMEAEAVQKLGREDAIDMTYFEKLTEDASNTIAKFGDVNWFLK